MLFCIAKRKIYEHVLGDLDLKTSQKIEKHLNSCLKCKDYANKIQKINQLDLSSEQPFLNEVFWRKFDERLDLSMAQQKTTYKKTILDKIISNLKDRIRMPLPAFVTVCMVLFFAIFSFNNYYSNRINISLTDEYVIETVLLVEDTSEVYLNGDEDAYVEEALLQMTLGQV